MTRPHEGEPQFRITTRWTPSRYTLLLIVRFRICHPNQPPGPGPFRRPMTDPTPSSVRLANHIARQLSQLTQLLSQSPPREAAQILGTVLDYDKGILGRVTELLATGSYYAQDRFPRSNLRPEVSLALGRAANDLDDVGLDLDEHIDSIKQLAKPSGTAGGPAPKPVTSAMVVRRRP